MELFDESKVVIAVNGLQADLDVTVRSPTEIQADIKAQRSKPGEFYMTKPYNFSDAAKLFSVSCPQKNGDSFDYTVQGKSPFTGEKVNVKRRY